MPLTLQTTRAPATSTLAAYHFGDAGSVSKIHLAKRLRLKIPRRLDQASSVADIGYWDKLLLPSQTLQVLLGLRAAILRSRHGSRRHGRPRRNSFSRRDGTNTFLIGTNNGVPFVEINKQRSAAGEVITPSVWHHIAAVVEGQQNHIVCRWQPLQQPSDRTSPMTGAAQIGKDSTVAAWVCQGHR